MNSFAKSCNNASWLQLCFVWFFDSIDGYFFLFHFILVYLPQHDLNTYLSVNRSIELYLEWLSNQGPQSKYEYSTFCQGHSKLPIHTAPCLSQFPQQPITTALESRETIATMRPWMLLAGSIEWKRKETEVKKKKKKPVESLQLPNLPLSCWNLTMSLLTNLPCVQIVTNGWLARCNSQSPYVLFKISVNFLSFCLSSLSHSRKMSGFVGNESPILHTLRGDWCQVCEW